MNLTTQSAWDDEIFQDLPSPIISTNPLVNRKPHKSATYDAHGCLIVRAYDFKEFLSITPNKVIRYQKNMAPMPFTTMDACMSQGWEVDDFGKWSKPTVIAAITEDTRSHGLVSDKGNRNINLAIDWMVLLSKEKTELNQSITTSKSFYKWKLNFVTLTLSSKQRHSDKFLKKKLLGSFLDYLRKKKGIKNYVWRAESQANGNIHFHIITDTFLPWQQLRDVWNNIQEKLGYVSEFKKKFNHSNPNSTDVHSLIKIKNIGAYLSKYCSKNAKGITILSTRAKEIKEKGLPFFFLSTKWNYPSPLDKKTKRPVKFYRQIHGRLWGLSENLSKLKKCRTIVTPEIEEEIKYFVKHHANKIIDFDYVSVFQVHCKEFINHGLHNIRNIFASFVRNIIYPPPQLNLDL